MSDLVAHPDTLPYGAVEKRGVGWWGALTLIGAEAALFGYLLFAYAYTALQIGPAFLPTKPPELALALPNTAILLASSVVVWWGEKAIKAGRAGRLIGAFALAFVMGAVFVGIQLKEWRGKEFTIQSSPYGSFYYTITGFHMAHVLAGLLGLLAIVVWASRGYFDRRRNVAVSIAAVYWHFVDVVWLLVFTAFYLAPRLG